MNAFVLRIAAAATAILMTAQAWADTEADTAASSGKPALPRAEIEGIIKDYIMKHPEVIQQSFMEMQKREQEKRMAAMKKGAVKYKKELAGDENTPSVGDPATATVTITEFYDFHCGYCKQMVSVLSKVLDEDKHVRIVFKDFPIFGADSELAAKASLAFYRLNKEHYFDFYKELMKVSGHFDDKALEDAAEKFGVKGDALKAEMDKPEIAEALKQNKELGKNLSITGTPAIFVGTEVMGGAGSYEDLTKAIKKVREKKE